MAIAEQLETLKNNLLTEKVSAQQEHYRASRACAKGFERQQLAHRQTASIVESVDRQNYVERQISAHHRYLVCTQQRQESDDLQIDAASRALHQQLTKQRTRQLQEVREKQSDYQEQIWYCTLSIKHALEESETQHDTRRN